MASERSLPEALSELLPLHAMQAAHAREAVLRQELQQLTSRLQTATIASGPGSEAEGGTDAGHTAAGSALLLGSTRGPSSAPGVLGSQLEGALRELAQAHARAASAELQLELTEKEVAAARVGSDCKT
jgi:hypothetical protein